jgi:hypothetical protein
MISKKWLLPWRKEKIIKALSSTEPRYKRAAKFGVEALPYLETLIKNKNINPYQE